MWIVFQSGLFKRAMRFPVVGWSEIITAVSCIYLVAYVYKLLHHFDTTWDVLAYHLAFAAKRGAITNADTLILSSHIGQRYLGFPPLVDYVSGGLWRLAGSPQGGNLINPIAIAALAIYVHVFNRVSLFWTILIFAAIPALHTELASQYVDLWTNAFFALFLTAAYNFLFREQPRAIHFWIACISLAISIGSKPQFYVIGALGGLCFFIGIFDAIFVGRRFGGDRKTILRLYALIFVLVSPLIWAWPIANVIRFGNPVYPVSVRIANYQLPGTESTDAYLGTGPVFLRHRPNWEKWILSILEYRSLSMRPGGYTLGQGDVENGSESDRMGGSALVLITVAISSLALGISSLKYRRPAILSMAVMLALGFVIAFVPGSFDLRYFTFLEIVLLIASLSMLSNLTANGDLKCAGMFVGLKAALLGAALFVSFVTGFHYVWPNRVDVTAVVAGYRSELLDALAHSHVLCYPKRAPYGILYSKILNADLPVDYTVVLSDGPDTCPATSFILR
jgi:hypothetical protein